MNKIRTFTLLVAVLMLNLPGAAMAHPGRTDSSGCHTNRSTGEYHCHRSSPTPPSNRPAPSQPAPSTTCSAIFAAQEAPAPVGYEFTDLEGDLARVTWAGNEEGGTYLYDVFFPATGRTLHIAFIGLNWRSYFNGRNNSAQYSVWWDNHQAEAEHRTQSGCEGRRSYAANLIRHLHF